MERMLPTLCPHCAKAGRLPRYVYNPPAWVGALWALRKAPWHAPLSAESVAGSLAVSPHKARRLLRDARAHGAVAEFAEGFGLWRKTAKGTQILRAWISVGWNPSIKVGQRQARAVKRQARTDSSGVCGPALDALRELGHNF